MKTPLAVDTTLREKLCKIRHMTFSPQGKDIRINVYSIGKLYGFRFNETGSVEVFYEEFENFRMAHTSVFDISKIDVVSQYLPRGIAFGYYAEVWNKDNYEPTCIQLQKYGDSFFQSNTDSSYHDLNDYKASLLLGKNHISKDVKISHSLIIDSNLFIPAKIISKYINKSTPSENDLYSMDL